MTTPKDPPPAAKPAAKKPAAKRAAKPKTTPKDPPPAAKPASVQADEATGPEAIVLAQAIKGPGGVSLPGGTVVRVGTKLKAPVGEGPGEIPASYLKGQPLLDLAHPENQTGLAASRAFAAELAEQRKSAAERAGDHAANRLKRRRNLGLGGIPLG